MVSLPHHIQFIFFPYVHTHSADNVLNHSRTSQWDLLLIFPGGHRAFSQH